MIVHFSLCRGASLRLCGSCYRNLEVHPAAAGEPHQAFVTPTTRGERCNYWKARPALNPPRTHTGD